MIDSFKTTALIWFAAAGVATAAGSLKFEQNRGQTAPEYSYLVKARGQTVFFGKDYSLIELHGQNREVASVRMQLAGANPKSEWTPAGEETGRISYLVGSDQSRWIYGAAQYAKLERKGIYPYTDLVLYGDGASLEYDLILRPGADPARIRLRFDSPWAAKARPDGTIEIETPAGALLQKTPRIYQQSGALVRGRFVAAGKNEFRLEVDDYDRSQSLIVDPVIEAAAYYGGELDDQVIVAGIDFIAGNTSSVDFEGAIGSRRGRDIFVQFTDPSAGVLGSLFGAYGNYFVFGGSDDDELTCASTLYTGINRNNTSNVFYLGGVTKSLDLTPPTATGPGAHYGGGASDGFVMQFAIAYGGPGYNLPTPSFVYWGGSGEDRIEAMSGSGSNYYGYVAFTGSTDSSDFPVTAGAPQSNLAGGKDAFVATMSFSFNNLFNFFSSYLGGAGDDYGWAIVEDSRGIYVAGETHSTDFTVAGSQPGALQGASDGFFALLTADSNNRYFWKFSRYIGGSGNDSIRALAETPNYSVNGIVYTAAHSTMVLAGETSSTDFPVVNAAQKNLGGGTDAFAMRYAADSDQVVFSTYWGGSGDESATAVAQRADLQLMLAGNTRSTDFPVLNPVQGGLGGGQDGFLALFSSTGQAQFSTYYGGSGDESVHSVAPVQNGPARLGGDTTSSDLPGVSGPLLKDGGLDGFSADIGAPIVVAPLSVSVAKGGIVTIPYDRSASSPQLIAARTLDSAKVQIWTANGLVNENHFAAGTNLQIEGLADTGSAQIEIDIAGFPATFVTVNLHPMIIVPMVQTAGTHTLWDPIPLLYAQFCAFNQDTKQIETCGSIDPALVALLTWTSSNPTVVAVKANSQGNYDVQFLSRGTATLTATSTSLVATPSSFDITVIGAGANVPAQIALGKDLQTSVSLQYPTLTQQGRSLIHVASSDPSLALIDAGGKASSQLVIDPNAYYSGAGFLIQALSDSGSATLTLTSADWDASYTTTVMFSPTYLDISPVPQNQLPNSQGYLGLTINFDGAPVNTNFGYSFRAAATPMLQLTSSNPDVAVPQVATVTFSGNSYGFAILTKAAGTATITAQPVPPSSATVRGALTLNVAPAIVPPLRLTAPAQVTLGKDMQNTFAAALTGGGGVNVPKVIYTIADPTLAVISTNSSAPGASSVTVSANQNVYIQALAGSGSTTISMTTSDGLTSATTTLNLVPSGIGFSTRDIRLASAGPAASVSVQAFNLDPNTGFPTGPAALRPGISVDLTISTNGSSATVTGNSTISQASNIPFTVSPVGLGITAFTLNTPAGFSPLPRRSELDVTVVKSKLQLSSHGAIQNGLTACQVMGGTAGVSVRIDSGDPSKLLLATASANSGSASIVVPPGQTFYFVGVASSGMVPVHVSSDSYDPVDDSVLIEPMLVSLSPNSYSPSSVLNLISGTQSSSLTVSVFGLATNIAGIAPGLTLNFSLTSSVPGVADVGSATVSLTGSTVTANIPVTPKTPGTTVISLKPPTGISLVGSAVTVNVTLPQFILYNQSNTSTALQVSQDLVLPVNLSTNAGGLADNFIVKVTSLNPDLLLVSRTSDGTASATASIAYPINSSQQTFYLDAVAGSGTAQLLITAAGFQDLTVPIGLAPLSFAWNTAGRPQIPAGSAAQLSMIVSGSGSYFRPGAPPYSVAVGTDPPNAALLTPSAFAFNVGNASLLQSISVAPASAGSFDLVATLPNGTTLRQGVDVPATPISTSCAYQPISIGKDLYTSCTFTTPTAVQLSLASSDPTLLLTTTTQSARGSAKTYIDMQPNVPVTVYLQALAASGSPTLLAQASGYADLSLPITLTPSGILVSPSIPLAQAGATPLSFTAQLNLSVVSLNSSGSVISTNSPIRPGATPFSVAATSSSPNVAVLDTTILTFQGGDSSKAFNVKPGISGTSLVTISAPAIWAVVGNSSILFGVK